MKPTSNSTMCKRFFHVLFILLIGIISANTFTSCSSDDDDNGGGSSGGSGGGGNDGITAANWTSKVNETYGVNVTVPSGWTFSKGTSSSPYYPVYDIQFTTTAEDFNAALLELAQKVFEATETASEHGNFNAETISPFVKGETLTEFNPNWTLWYFAKSDGRVIQCNVSGNSTSKLAQISFITTTGNL